MGKNLNSRRPIRPRCFRHPQVDRAGVTDGGGKRGGRQQLAAAVYQRAVERYAGRAVDAVKVGACSVLRRIPQIKNTGIVRDGRVIGDMVYISRVTTDKAVKRRIFAGANTATRVRKVLQQHVSFYGILCSAEHAIEAEYQHEE